MKNVIKNFCTYIFIIKIFRDYHADIKYYFGRYNSQSTIVKMTGAFMINKNILLPKFIILVLEKIYVVIKFWCHKCKNYFLVNIKRYFAK